ncbi:hypothetical protein llap_4264 [Limosa lapponica baueri]|uniref:Uncharacterized protein n=1 Tax=Limosa lapponica baueri TaxID=1758121 RepID=A0A2I0UHC7_LIMLA|nr:hypothetical protein llap_4264 [Limosa lapponica baueri]
MLLFDVAQETVGFLGFECTLPAHVQLFIHEYPPSALLKGIQIQDGELECLILPDVEVYAQKANRILGCIKSSMASRSKGGDSAPLLCPGETSPGVLCPALRMLAQEGHGPVAAGPEEATKMIRGLEHLSYEDRMRELGLFSLEKRRLRGDLIAAFQYLKGAYNKDGDKLFSKACCDRTKGHCFKLKEGRFRLDIRKTFFMMKVMRHWKMLPREVVDAPSLETFKARLDGALSNLILLKMSPQRWIGLDNL